MAEGAMGPAERYVRDFTLQRQQSSEGWTEMEHALVLTLIDWRVEADMRPSSGEGSDCSDLMDTALARILGLASGDLTPAQVIESIEPMPEDDPPDPREQEDAAPVPDCPACGNPLGLYYAECLVCYAAAGGA